MFVTYTMTGIKEYTPSPMEDAAVANIVKALSSNGWKIDLTTKLPGYACGTFEIEAK